MTTYTGSIETFSAGEKLTAAGLQTVTDSLHAVEDAWTSYTPTWSSTGTQPAIVNGTIVGEYIQVGKLVHYRATITMGAGTTFGTGNYSVSIPVTALDAGWCGELFMFDNSTAGNRQAGCTNGSTSATQLFMGFVAAAGGGIVTPTLPFTWAASDVIKISGTYEAA